jgi:hypothetical protein
VLEREKKAQKTATVAVGQVNQTSEASASEMGEAKRKTASVSDLCALQAEFQQ